MKKIRKITPEEVKAGGRYQMTFPTDQCAGNTVRILKISGWDESLTIRVYDNRGVFDAYFSECYIFRNLEEALVFKIRDTVYTYSDDPRYSGSWYVVYTQLAEYYQHWGGLKLNNGGS